MRVFLLVAAAVFGAWLGYIVGFLICWYGGDRDVGSALAVVVCVPVGILVCSIGAYVVATMVLRRFEVSKGNAPTP